jgi:hypothetical protein
MYVLTMARVDCKSCVLIVIKITPCFEVILIFSEQVRNLVSGCRALVIVFTMLEDNSDGRFSIDI